MQERRIQCGVERGGRELEAAAPRTEITIRNMRNPIAVIFLVSVSIGHGCVRMLDIYMHAGGLGGFIQMWWRSEGKYGIFNGWNMLIRTDCPPCTLVGGDSRRAGDHLE